MEYGLYEGALWAFHDKVMGLLGEGTPIDYTVEPGIAGLTVRLFYDKGRLSRATALDPCGRAWEVTGNIKTILTVPLALSMGRRGLPIPEGLETEGVVYLEHESLAMVNMARAKKVMPHHEDSREAATEAFLREDPRVTAKTPLHMFCSEILRWDGVNFATHYEAMLQGQALGLRVNRPHLRVCPGISEVLTSCLELRDTAGTLAYPVEGVVVRVNRMGLRERGGPWALTLPFEGESKGLA